MKNESPFSIYIEGCPNSFDANFETFNHNEPLYPLHLLVNLNTKFIVCNTPFFAEKGFFLKNDSIIPNSYGMSNNEEVNIVKLKLISWNRYYYTYKETRNGFQYAIYTKLGFEKL